MSAVAKSRSVEERALAVRTLLHLPRIARHDGHVGRRLALAEISRSARHLSADIAAVRALVPTSAAERVAELMFDKYEDDKAFAIFTHLHYLHSARPGALNFALLDRHTELPIALCSANLLDWQRLGHGLERWYGVPMDRVWDISRVYSFDVAPRNAISNLLGHVRRWFREYRPAARLLVTTVDPNMGFSGVSYRGANWKQWMTVRPRPYIYQKRQYVSPRQLRIRFGTANVEDVRSRAGAELQLSRAKLLDSSIYACRLHGATEQVGSNRMPRLRR
ncbi:Mom family adenine methylcarbamoylation protein [Kribbella sp. NPDC054772]